MPASCGADFGQSHPARQAARMPRFVRAAHNSERRVGICGSGCARTQAAPGCAKCRRAGRQGEQWNPHVREAAPAREPADAVDSRGCPARMPELGWGGIGTAFHAPFHPFAQVKEVECRKGDGLVSHRGQSLIATAGRYARACLREAGARALWSAVCICLRQLPWLRA